MGMEPNLNLKDQFELKTCARCGSARLIEKYPPAHSDFFSTYAWCDQCIDSYIAPKGEYLWDKIDKVCQWGNIPFLPKEFEAILDLKPPHPFHKYAEIFQDSEFKDLGWRDYYNRFKALKEKGLIEREIPLLSEVDLKRLHQKWGFNYCEEELDYLEELYTGLLSTQNVNGALQSDQAIKLCKISLEIDNRIREGLDIDKMLASYDKLVRIAEFTPKNVKNLNDFDSIGELCKYMEKRGWKNKFYDGVTKDIVDETIKNFQAFNQRLYVNENGIGEDITRRLEALQTAQEQESYYGTDSKYELDSFEAQGYDELFEEEEFEEEI